MRFNLPPDGESIVATDAKQSGKQQRGRPASVSGARARAGSSGPGGRRPDLTKLHHKARAALAEVLVPGEQPRVVITGLASSALIATDSRAFVFKAGARAGLPFGSRLKEFEFESVMRIDLRRAGEVDVVVIHAPLKISSCSSYWVDSRDDPWRARNAIAVARASKETELAVAELSRLVGERVTPSAPEDPAESNQTERGTAAVVDRIAVLERDTERAEILPVPSGGEGEPGVGPTTEDCPRCGKELSTGWQFCPRCGAPAGKKRSDRSAQRRRRRHS